jgi:hypothetical protein
MPVAQHGTFATLQWGQAPVEQGQDWQGGQSSSSEAVVTLWDRKPLSDGEPADLKDDVFPVVQSDSGRHSGQQQRQPAC